MDSSEARWASLPAARQAAAERRYGPVIRLARTAADLDAADALPVGGATATTEHLSLYGILLCNAGYAAAQAGDRSRSQELLADAHRAAARLGGNFNARWTAFADPPTSSSTRSAPPTLSATPVPPSNTPAA